MSTILIASDHGGFEAKEDLKKYLIEQGLRVEDLGTTGLDSVDYPDFALALSRRVAVERDLRGVLICGTGIGMSIAANRYEGIRAATCTTPEMARLSRTHNNANLLCLGRRFLSLDECFDLIGLWLDTDFSGVDRHIRRVGKMR